MRQSYTRLGKIALIRHQRYAHAKQLKRANRMLQTLRTQLGRVIRDIVRKIAGNAELRAIFARPLSLASQVRSQKQRQRGPKIYSQHAPEVACIGKGKAHRPYEFWRQGLGGDHAEPVQRRAVRRSCRGTAGQPL